MSLAAELERIKRAKEEIALVITDKGIPVPPEDRLDRYPMYISYIGASPPIDPGMYYRQNRPSSWMEIPEWINGEEIYLLFEIPIEKEALIAFTVECTGDFTVELGTFHNNEYAASFSESLASGAIYQNEISYADFVTDPSYASQCMIRVSGSNITSFRICHHDKIGNRHWNWNILEIKANLPKLQTIKVSGLKRLEYFSLSGTNLDNLTDTSGMFRDCCSLLAVLQFGDIGALKDASYMYADCVSLVAPVRGLAVGESTSHMFENCYSLVEVDTPYCPLAADYSSMFENCISLKKINMQSMRGAENCSRMFYGCRSLETAYLREANATDLSYMFYGCDSLKMTFDIQDMLFDRAVNLQYMFSHCAKLKHASFRIFSSFSNVEGVFKDCVSLAGIMLEIAHLKEKNIVNAKSMFENCYSLRGVSDVASEYTNLDSGKATDFSFMFRSCKNLQDIFCLDISQAAKAEGIFEDCLSLQSMSFYKNATGLKADISMKNCSLSYPAVAELLESLPSVTGLTLDLSGNPGAGEITEADIASAANKGWHLITEGTAVSA